MMSLSILNMKIRDRKACIGVLGLGYVGLPLALLFSRRYNVIGFDIDKEKINMLKNKKSYLIDINDTDLSEHKDFYPTYNEKDLIDCDFKIICVPTPLSNGKPDMSFVTNAAEIVSKNMKQDQFIIIESTVHPMATKEEILPILLGSGLNIGEFGLAFSPERIDPCNQKYNIYNIPKVVGGMNEEFTDIAAKLYESVINAEIIKVSSCEVAEATKILENTFRQVNIAMINELALLFERMGIDIWEVIRAASTKPFGFMPFYPGPGIGGHCTPVDPVYLMEKAKEYDFDTRFINLSTEINDYMKVHVIELVKIALEYNNKKINNSVVAVFGLSYKKNINDTREASAIKILENLKKGGAEIKVYDPFVKIIRTSSGDFLSERTPQDALENADCAVFLVDHDVFTNIKINEKVSIIDCKNIFNRDKITNRYYGIGKMMR